ncbi:discoidin domain-containing protein [Paenibacillus sp. CF384]|uniref:discoidin domain-containing protein n=1 Tax=Paenibacillus sp. CF384 TaxID=1884382 RepID=UPI000895875D|nr:discoidin domain-containing protein [Paenibacillus sp. CF384]SDW47288.1 F5/8 type C domain-containing protein [Paenibacillus sp. CF384]
MKRSYLGLFVLLLIFTMIGPINVAEAKPTKVSVGQTGSVVTADNGAIALTYDLATGRGSFKQGSTTLISNFYSDYELYGTSSRIHSYDPGTRSAKWEAIGNDGYGKHGERITIKSVLDSGSTITLRLTMYEDQPYFLSDMTVSNAASQTISVLEPIASDNLDIGSGTDKRIYTTPYTNNYDFGVAPVDNFGKSQNGYDRPYGVEDQWSAFNGTSYWVAAVFDNTAKNGIVAGAATTKAWKSMQHLGQAAAPNGPLTGFSIYNAGGQQSGTSVSSDAFFMGYFDNYETGLETFGEAYAVEEPMLQWKGDVPRGYNTWYNFYSQYATADAMYAMTDYFVAHLKSLGYTYMNLDASYQGIKGQEQIRNLKDYVTYVHSKGMKAGSYEAPFAIWNKLTDTVPTTNYTFGDIALKDTNGNPVMSYLNTPIVDATHPGGQVYLKWLMNTNHVEPGFDYVKLDFIDFGMYEGSFYDKSKNGIQAYRIGMKIMRDALIGARQKIFIDESIAPLLPSGYAHGRRTGCDTVIGLDDGAGIRYSGIERQAFNAAASWWTNGTLYPFNDADMSMPENIVQGVYGKTTLNQATLLTTAIVMGGGHLLLGDDIPFISDDRMKRLVMNKELLDVASLGKAARPLSMTNFYLKGEHSPAVTYLKDKNGDILVGISNWDMNNSQPVTVPFPDLELRADKAYTLSELYSQTTIGSYTGSYSRMLRAGESIIIRISAKGPRGNTEAPLNLALGAGVTASASTSYGAGYEASNIIDGNLATRWSAGWPANNDFSNQWLEINFGAPVSVNRVVVSEYGYDKQEYETWAYALQYWDDAASQYVDLTKGLTLGDRRELDFKTVTTSKIRLYMKTSHWLGSVNEIEAYNIPGNTGSVIAQDDSNESFSGYSDIRGQTQRMQTFTLTSRSLPKLDVYYYESYVSKVPEDNLYIDIVELDSNLRPAKKLFTAAVPPYNLMGSPQPYSIYPRLSGLDTAKKYGFILRSPNTLDDGSTDNKYGFGYSSDVYAGGIAQYSGDGGQTWSPQTDTDLIFTIYQ